MFFKVVPLLIAQAVDFFFGRLSAIFVEIRGGSMIDSAPSSVLLHINAAEAIPTARNEYQHRIASFFLRSSRNSEGSFSVQIPSYLVRLIIT